MSDYVIKPGIALLNIQNVWLLCADRNARSECRFVYEINETGAAVWKMLVDGKDLNSIVNTLSYEYQVDNTEILREDINAFIDCLIRNRYLTMADKS